MRVVRQQCLLHRVVWRRLDDYPALHRYSDKQAQEYEARRFTSVRGRAVDAVEWLLLRRAVARVERLGGPLHSILDVPAGTGRMAKRLSARGFEVTGVDASEDMLAVARSVDAPHAYHVGRAEHLPFTSQSFDAVVSVRLFGHLPNSAKSEVLKEFRRVARRGAIVFVPGQTRWLRMRRAWQAGRGRTLRSWNPVSSSQMQALADQADFTVLCTTHLLGAFSETRAVILVPK
jgi:2-polyprenyl-3-methyl-5-hydroxy-6-metoxy-1,4-benzoquinol methylase